MSTPHTKEGQTAMTTTETEHSTAYTLADELRDEIFDVLGDLDRDITTAAERKATLKRLADGEIEQWLDALGRVLEEIENLEGAAEGGSGIQYHEIELEDGRTARLPFQNWGVADRRRLIQALIPDAEGSMWQTETAFVLAAASVLDPDGLALVEGLTDERKADVLRVRWAHPLLAGNDR